MSQVDSIAAPNPSPVSRLGGAAGILPGLGLSLGLTGVALAIRQIPGMGMFSPAILAILLGIAARQIIGMPAVLRPGLTFSMRTMLRLAVVLLGLQVTVGQMLALGLPALLAVAGGLLICFFGTQWLGARLGVDPKLSRLIATGTSVCGASAVVAANSITRGEDEDVAYALAAVTVFGTIAMLAQPAAALVFHLDETRAALWLGASIHEVAQVVGGATQLGPEATANATMAKMVRILLLAPMVLTMAAVEHRSQRKAREAGAAAQAKVPVPWFAFGFLALAGVASLHLVPPPVVKQVGLASSTMLAAALAAMGFGIEVRAIRRKGGRPLLLALSSWVIIMAGSYLLLVLAD